MFEIQSSRTRARRDAVVALREIAGDMPESAVDLRARIEEVAVALESVPTSIWHSTHVRHLHTRILVVDDSDAQRDLIRAIAEMHGWHHDSILEASDPRVALGHIEREQRIDAAIVDYRLHDPDLDGVSVVGALHKRHPKALVVLMSATVGQVETARLAYDAGATFCIPKAVELDQECTMLHAIVRVLTQAVEHHE